MYSENIWRSVFLSSENLTLGIGPYIEKYKMKKFE